MTADLSAGLLAEFADPGAMLRAAEALRAARIGPVQTHSPAPANDDRRSLLPLAILLAGLGGAAATFAMQWYATTLGYAVNIGGRSQFSWPAFVPMAFEFGVLSAVVAGVVGFLIACRLPALYDSIDEIDGFRRASRDGYFVALRATDGAALGRARALLDAQDALWLTELPR